MFTYFKILQFCFINISVRFFSYFPKAALTIIIDTWTISCYGAIMISCSIVQIKEKYLAPKFFCLTSNTFRPASSTVSCYKQSPVAIRQWRACFNLLFVGVVRATWHSARTDLLMPSLRLLYEHFFTMFLKLLRSNEMEYFLRFYSVFWIKFPLFKFIRSFQNILLRYRKYFGLNKQK